MMASETKEFVETCWNEFYWLLGYDLFSKYRKSFLYFIFDFSNYCLQILFYFFTTFVPLFLHKFIKSFIPFQYIELYIWL